VNAVRVFGFVVLKSVPALLVHGLFLDFMPKIRAVVFCAKY